jgi:alpha-aminoadipic semialdehyde synthase
MLPADLPKEASKHFSKLLLRFIEQLSTSDGSVESEHQSDLPSEMVRACITSKGELTPNFRYIKALRRQTMDAGLSMKSPEVVIRIDGHLFDTGLINQILALRS